MKLENRKEGTMHMLDMGQMVAHLHCKHFKIGIPGTLSSVNILTYKCVPEHMLWHKVEKRTVREQTTCSYLLY